jgi:transcriptional regulator with XRE-family HTH domain
LTPAAIRENRLRLNLTQRELAEQLDIAEATLSRWETGAQIQQRAFDRLLRAYFGVPALRKFLKQEFDQSTLAINSSAAELHEAAPA